MGGRGSNNKHGSAGRGASNQSNQRFVTDGQREPASNHHRRPAEERRIEIQVDQTPYILQVTPFNFNEEVRYHVSYNGSPDILFAWDNRVGHFAAFGDEAATLPDNLELEIARKLQQMMKKDMVA
ncbi:MAG TPA: hypothetical protein VF145_07145 [Chitinophagaceae bacterium]